jgi:C4-dicarboxylate-specific signal transduction histidine kinase
MWTTDRGRSLFGLKPDARLDYLAMLARVHPEDRAACERAITQAVQARGEYELEYRVHGTDGMVRWIDGRGRCAGPDDGTGGKLFGVSMDVTARKQAEASAAQKRAELEHVARVATLGQLTATLTHELRQPLASILTSSYLGVHLLDAPEPDLQDLRVPVKIAQEQLGHSSISTTLNIYTHVVDASHRQAIEALERELFPSVPKLPDGAKPAKSATRDFRVA